MPINMPVIKAESGVVKIFLVKTYVFPVEG